MRRLLWPRGGNHPGLWTLAFLWTLRFSTTFIEFGSHNERILSQKMDTIVSKISVDLESKTGTIEVSVHALLL